MAGVRISTSVTLQSILVSVSEATALRLDINVNLVTVTGRIVSQGRALSQQRLRSSAQNISMSIQVSGTNQATLLERTTALANNITSNAPQFIREVQDKLELIVGAGPAAAALADASVPGGATVVIPTPTPQPLPASPGDTDKGLSGGAISGIVIGTLAFVALVVAAAIYYKKRRTASAGTRIEEYGNNYGSLKNAATTGAPRQ
jgi:hypothetical protein